MFSRRQGSTSTLLILYVIVGLTIWCGVSISQEFEYFFASEKVDGVVTGWVQKAEERNRRTTIEFTDLEGRERVEDFQAGKGTEKGEVIEVHVGRFTGNAEVGGPTTKRLVGGAAVKLLGLIVLLAVFTHFFRDYRREGRETTDPDPEPASELRGERKAGTRRPAASGVTR